MSAWPHYLKQKYGNEELWHHQRSAMMKVPPMEYQSILCPMIESHILLLFSHEVIPNSVTTWIAARQAPLSPLCPNVCSNSCPLSC